jgi:hypothetical protein
MPYQHGILTLLKGVAVPTASALLMVRDKDRHTVIDVNATWALCDLGEFDTDDPSYLDYLTVCQGISRHCGRDLRTVDRALFECRASRRRRRRPRRPLNNPRLGRRV